MRFVHHVRRNTVLALLFSAMLCGQDPALAGEVHEVQQIEFSFVPQEVTVEVGDTVRWIWSFDFHTVTSGADCLFDGVFFDQPLDPDHPVVEFVVPDIKGQLPYFCRPHCELFEMVGTIIVVAAPCPADLDDSGDVGFPDLLMVLSAWGPCDEDCPEDLDGSKDVGFDDLLLLLAAWGPCA